MKLRSLFRRSKKKIVIHDVYSKRPRKIGPVTVWLHRTFRPVRPFIRYGTHHKRLVASVLAVVLVLTGFGIHRLTTKAAIAKLYPTTCLGGWERAVLAAGEPDSQEGYLEANSAVLPADSQAQIFCSGFIGELPDKKIQEKVVLRLSWGYETTLVPEEPVATTTIHIDDSFERSVPDIIDLPEDTPAEVVVPIPSLEEEVPGTPPEEVGPPVEEPALPLEPVPDPGPSPEPVSEPEVVPEPEEASAEEPEAQPEPEPEPEPEPVSFFRTLIPRAHAQEAEEVPIPEPEVEIEIEREIEPLPPTDESILEILYTLDGESWQPLARVSSVYAEHTFEIPNELFATPADLARLQIAVQALPTVSERAPIFLDAMWLEVEFVDLNEDLMIPPNVALGDVIVEEVPYEHLVAVLALRGADPIATTTDPLVVENIATTTEPILVPDASSTTEPIVEPEVVATSNELEISPEESAPISTGDGSDLELWLYDTTTNSWFRIATSELLSKTPQVEFVDGNIFWLGENDKTVWKFNPLSGGYESVSVSNGAPPTLLFRNEGGDSRALIFEDTHGPFQIENAPTP